MVARSKNGSRWWDGCVREVVGFRKVSVKNAAGYQSTVFVLDDGHEVFAGSVARPRYAVCNVCVAEKKRKSAEAAR